MDILPAIDIRRGRVVRLSQGEPGRETAYGDDALAQARRFIQQGARWLHVVDLDRAFGDGSNLAIVASIAAAAKGHTSVQCGGGVRSRAAVGELLDAGVTRVVVGTAAVTQPELVDELTATFGPDRIIVGLDARDGIVAIRGWTADSGETLEQVGGRVAGQGIRTVVYTDIARDGMLSGPDIDGCRMLAGLGVAVIASGGFATDQDVVLARDAGCAGAILGRSLYEGTIDLPRVLAVLS